MLEGKTVGYVFSGATPVGIFNLSDACRTGVAEAINELKSMGVKTAMLTGDNQAAAIHVQEQVHFESRTHDIPSLELFFLYLLGEDNMALTIQIVMITQGTSFKSCVEILHSFCVYLISNLA